MSWTKTRRAFIRDTALGFGAFVAFGASNAAAHDVPSLIEDVNSACRRLAPLGWRQLLLDATAGGLDITSNDLAAELTKDLPQIDRSFPGFGDFTLAGRRAIEAGRPERSLLYHALASPTVVADRTSTELRGFPTLAEIEAVENYVYGVSPPSLDDARQRAMAGHWEWWFSLRSIRVPRCRCIRGTRSCASHARASRALGTLPPFYDAKARNFVSLDEAQPFEFRGHAPALQRLSRGADARRLRHLRAAGPS